MHDEVRAQASWASSSVAQIIGASGPSRARRTSLIGIASGGAGQLVAAVGAAGRDDEAGVTEDERELLEVGARHVLGGGDLGEAGRPGAEMPPELDHQPNAVLALRGERDGARPVERGPMRTGRCGLRGALGGRGGAQEDVLNPK